MLSTLRSRTRRLLAILLLPVGAVSQTGTGPVTPEFPFAPARHLNAICLPDDWHKPLVTQDGAIAYDFGPGPYAAPLTQIGFGLAGGDERTIAQMLDDPRVPIPRTVLTARGDTLLTEAFTVIPPDGGLPQFPNSRGRVIRLNGLNGTRTWASPPPGTDPSFRSVAWGANRSILYRVRVAPGSGKQVALGLCEPYKSTPRARILSLQIEGAASVIADPLPDGVRNTPHVHLFTARDVDGDGLLRIEVHAAPDSPDPNVILNCFWVFPEDVRVTREEILTGKARPRAELIHACGTEFEEWMPVPRTEVLTARTSGVPVLRILSRRNVSLDVDRGIVMEGGRPFIITTPAATGVHRSSDTLTLSFPAGTGRVEARVLHGPASRSVPGQVPDTRSDRVRAVQYWLQSAPLPPGRVTVPDPRLQFLLDASVRNMYQIRDRVDGGIQYQPGPTVYRGLWLGDVFISGSVSLMLGDTATVREALERGLRFQEPGGQFVVLRPSTALNETPIFITMMCRYASFTGDRAWLRRHWQAVRDGIGWIARTQEATMVEPEAPYAGLMPPGFVDGGISHRTADYGTVWWAIIALEHAIRSAEELGQSEDSRSWAVVRQRFMAPLRRSILRDMKTDERGLEYLPITIGDTTSGIPPQRGQYAFLIPIPYSTLFTDPDPVLQRAFSATLAMLDRTTEQGIIIGSGWMHDGIWGWLAGIHSQAHLYRGNPDAAYRFIQAYADHATPLGTWVEEQQPRAAGVRTAGDMSNAEASAFFVQAVRALMVREHGDTLHLLGGIPPDWIRPGAVFGITRGGSLFGPVEIRIAVAADGRSAGVTVAPPQSGGRQPAVVLHLEAFRAGGFRLEGSPERDRMVLSGRDRVDLTLVRGR